MKRFGRPVYSGRVDLVTGPGINNGIWNLYTIDLADYIDVEPGVLYKVYSRDEKIIFSLSLHWYRMRRASMRKCFSRRKNRAGNPGMILIIIMRTC